MCYSRLNGDVADQDNGWYKKQTQPETWTAVHILILYTMKQLDKCYTCAQ